MSETSARDSVLAAFRWVDGHADVWRLFRDPVVMRLLVRHLSEIVRQRDATKVAGIESRGFVLGGAVAVDAGVGFVPIRKAAGLFPGEKATARAAVDYRGHQHLLRMQRESVLPGDRVLLVDDWAETGSQATAARQLIEDCGGHWAGTALVVDQLSDPTRAALSPVSAVITADDLGPSD